MISHLPKEQLNLSIEICKPLPFAISKGGFSLLVDEIAPNLSFNIISL
jgi:hypothetical protein